MFGTFLSNLGGGGESVVMLYMFHVAQFIMFGLLVNEERVNRSKGSFINNVSTQ